VNSSVFAEVPAWQRWLRGGAFGGSIAFHAVAAMFLFSSRPEAAQTENWVEMAVVEPPPPEAEPPPPEPEPEPEKPKPKPVEKAEAVPPPEEAPPPPRAPIRIAQGLSASSFAPGSGTSFDVRAGTTTMAKAGPDTMSLDEANGPACTDPPVAAKIKVKPMMEVPDEAQKAGVEGQITVLVDIDAEGRVTSARVQKGLGYGTEDACVAAWLKARFRPASRCGTPAPMNGVPQRCTVDAIE
jgi:periplasmic protein TonB